MAAQASPVPTTTEAVNSFTREVSQEERGPVRAGLIEATPLLAGIVPLGMAIGVAVSDSPVHDGAGWAASLLIFGASAQMAAISAVTAGGGLLAVLAAVLLVQARLVIYSALLAPVFRSQPRWFRWAAPYFLLDQLYALLTQRIDEGRSADWIRRYYLGIGLAVLAIWPVAVAIGVLAGPVIPVEWNLGLAGPLLLAGLLAPALATRRALIVAAIAAAVAIVAATLPAGTGLLAGTAAGTVAGVWLERRAK